MFNKEYDSFACERAIKGAAKVFYVLGIILMCLGALAFIILASIDDDLILWGVIAFVVAFLLGLCSALSAHLVWGFGDVVANTKKISEGSNNNTSAIDVNELPEL